MEQLTHVDENGVKIVDISKKNDVYRECTAKGLIKLKSSTIKAIVKNEIAKGDVLTTAQVAGTMAVKNTSNMIPMCHPVPITSVKVRFDINEKENTVEAVCNVKSTYKTGIEMESLTGVSVALLTIWDMVKAVEKDENGQYPDTNIFNIRVVEKIKRDVE
ncbi:cyclic pyranopterin monophosphate synthase MoaC [Methanococcus voltae]|uniref:cyclic pyranopterin monophosphate synthase MoaC n=1 Tax=Methanococcus voltae TaxID=2188 RepID=UPI001AE28A94|nr:cyclic pyranopterin monophosphate synthase MoaC [Methanococcus voltae]MBP2172982.1 cyclic pyranopterin phosphate synthase [Methanococcus voltae]